MKEKSRYINNLSSLNKDQEHTGEFMMSELPPERRAKKNKAYCTGRCGNYYNKKLKKVPRNTDQCPECQTYLVWE